MIARPKRIVLGTLRFSDNLGDVIIGDCLEYLINSINPALVIDHLDIAGRALPNSEHTNARKKLVFYRIPSSLRSASFLVYWLTVGYRNVKRIVGTVDQNSVFIFGGGQIISDFAWNFPLKIAYITKKLERASRPTAFHAVGCSAPISGFGKYLFRSALCSKVVSRVSVRDPKSRSNLIALVPDKQVGLTVDPAVWARDVYSLTLRSKNVGAQLGDGRTAARNLIGLNVMNPDSIAIEGRNSSRIDSKGMLIWWRNVVSLLEVKNYIPLLFTNGAEEDQEFLATLRSSLLVERSHKLLVMDRPTNPKQLVDIIRGVKGVIAFRMHASIVAYSFGVPFVGIAWDSKVGSFAKRVKRAQWSLPLTSKPNEVVARIECAIQEGIDVAAMRKLKNISKSQLKEMLYDLTGREEQ